MAICAVGAPRQDIAVGFVQQPLFASAVVGPGFELASQIKDKAGARAARIDDYVKQFLAVQIACGTINAPWRRGVADKDAVRANQPFAAVDPKMPTATDVDGTPCEQFLNPWRNAFRGSARLSNHEAR